MLQLLTSLVDLINVNLFFQPWSTRPKLPETTLGQNSFVPPELHKPVQLRARGKWGKEARGVDIRYFDAPQLKHYTYRVFFPAQCDRQHLLDFVRSGPIDESWPIVFSARSTSCPERKPSSHSADWQVDSATMYDTDTHIAVSVRET